MNAPSLRSVAPRPRFGLKGPRAAEWLAARGLALPEAPNTWLHSRVPPASRILIARLGSGEFFVEDESAQGAIEAPAVDAPPPGVYPVLREDAAFVLEGAGAHDVLAQVCGIDFAAMAPAAWNRGTARPEAVPPDAAWPDAASSYAALPGAALSGAALSGAAVPGAALPGAALPVVMTLMAGVAVLVIAQELPSGAGYRIWCDPSHGEYLGATLSAIVTECGGTVGEAP